jgi:NCAIR mutase (PurE)-related protein
VDRHRIRTLLDQVRSGEIDIERALEALARLPFSDVSDARVDTHRALRTGIPEVIYAPGKTAEQIGEIVRTLREAGQDVLVTRVSEDTAARVRGALAAGDYEPVGRTLWFGPSEVPTVGKGTIAVVSAGTADLPVATEATTVARRFGNEVDVLADVGVAGLHRLLAANDQLRAARVLIVVAGMEGALPTSVGYGASFGGIAALLGMLTSCASNVTVVNIDNGFGAAYVATLINRL